MILARSAPENPVESVQADQQLVKRSFSLVVASAAHVDAAVPAHGIELVGRGLSVASI
jgi:hypothetical protein